MERRKPVNVPALEPTPRLPRSRKWPATHVAGYGLSGLEVLLTGRLTVASTPTTYSLVLGRVARTTKNGYRRLDPSDAGEFKA